MRDHRRLFCILALSSFYGTACRSAGPGTPIAAIPADAATVIHDSLTIQSSTLNERRLINVHLPASYRDAGSSAQRRYAVLYMPDGGMDEDFPHVVHAVDSLTAAGAIRPVIVVGVPNTERRRDLTGPTRIASDSAIAPHVGGSAAFRRFFETELIPAINARYRTTSERAIIGESLAGLFIVETALRQPTLFDHYVAFDPSLWWNKGLLVDSASALLSAAPTSASRRTLYVAASQDDIDNQTTRLAGILRMRSPMWLSLTFEPRPDLTHATIFHALEITGLVNALR